MPTISIKETKYSYNEDEIITFTEGLIGLPKMKRAVFIPLPNYKPFHWFASLDDDKNRFIVIDPSEVYPNYELPELPELKALNILEQPNSLLSIVKISSDWKKTTVNLRAPIFINWETKKGVQIILANTNYQLTEALPQLSTSC